MTPQEIFNVALNEYARVENEIDELSALVQKVYPKFSAEVAKRQFDLILQTILLKVAIANGELCNIEKEFIAKITSHTSITELFKKKDGSIMQWEEIVDAGVKGAEFVLDKIATYIDEKTKEFLQYFAPMDVVIEKDYLAVFKDAMFTIAKCFIMIDGKVEQKEVDVAGSLLAEFLSTWDSMVESGREHLAKKEAEKNGGSLKDSFLKKKN